MANMNLATSALERTWVYRAWQAPFAGQKFLPVLTHNHMQRVRRVLDVACGPGTNTKFFTSADYLGIDFNERYIRAARKLTGAILWWPTCGTMLLRPKTDSISYWSTAFSTT